MITCRGIYSALAMILLILTGLGGLSSAGASYLGPYKGGDTLVMAANSTCPPIDPTVTMFVNQTILSESYAQYTGYANADSWGWQLNAGTASTASYYDWYQFVMHPTDNGSQTGIDLQIPYNHFYDNAQANVDYYIGLGGYVNRIQVVLNAENQAIGAKYFIYTSNANYADNDSVYAKYVPILTGGNYEQLVSQTNAIVAQVFQYATKAAALVGSGDSNVTFIGGNGEFTYPSGYSITQYALGVIIGVSNNLTVRHFLLVVSPTPSHCYRFFPTNRL